MEKLDLRNQYLAKLKKENDINIPEEYTLLRNQNYCEWLENKLTEDVEFCMPDEINSEQEHLQYLKDSGYLKKLQHHKDTTVGLYATDKEIGDLLYLFWQSSSDACPLDITEAEKQESKFREWVKTISWRIDF